MCSTVIQTSDPESVPNMQTTRIPSYLSKSRHGVYYVRFATPTALKRAYPSLPTEIRKSLSTRDLRDAVARSRKLVLDFHLSMSKTLDAMNPKDDSYNGQFYVGVDKNTGDVRIQFEKGDDPNEVKEHLMMMQAIGMLPKHASVVDTMGIDPTPAERLAVKMEYQAQKPGGMWLSDLIQNFATEKLQTKKWNDNTWTQTYQPLLRDFRELVSKSKREITNKDGTTEDIWDIPAYELSEDHISRYVDAMWRFPANYGSMKSLKDAKQALNSGLEAQSFENAQKKIRMTRTFLLWAYKKRKLSEDLATSLPSETKDKKRDKSKDGYQPWTDPELKKIFERSNYPADGYRYWTPLLALYTGGRANEIAQLQAYDVFKTSEGVDVISIMDDPYTDVDDDEPLDDKPVNTKSVNIKSVKTAASRRWVPIHPKLIEAGFLDFVAYMKGKGEVRLFPELSYYKKGGYGRTPSRNFAEVTKKLKLWVRRKKVFHSFRTTFNSRLMKMGTSLELREFILGHSSDSINVQAYGKQIEDRPYHLLQQEVNKVDFGLTHKKWEMKLELPEL